MSIEPIHELPADELELILRNARKFHEWDIEPKDWHLKELIKSVKKSLTYFLPDDADLIKDINDAKEATLIINTFTDYPHPLKEGLIALREIFNVINTSSEKYTLLKIREAIGDYLISIEPFVLREKLNKFQLSQKKKRAKRKTWHGLNKEEIKIRDQNIIDKFKNSKLTSNNFANKYQNEFDLKPSQIRTIIRKEQNK